ncbi:hypothetical protein, partial [Bacteroides cellulosilyticus]|uniref:hypothetical protein n=1 Tax=Bacteroides cellulosilyticus TaxID=246787 RepID=UPI0034A11DD3
LPLVIITDSFPVKNSVFFAHCPKIHREFHPITPKTWRLLYTKAATRKFGQRLHKNPLINFSIAVGLKSIHSRFFRNSSKHNLLINIIVKLLYPGKTFFLR